MSTSFNFPPNPTLNQIVTLPDGNQAQWNGSAWVSVTNNVTYPLAVASGGTGATNPATARINLGLNSATGEFIVQKDGTVTAPGIAFASEPGLGWYRSGTNVMRLAVAGAQQLAFGMSDPTLMYMGLQPRTAGRAQINLSGYPNGAADSRSMVFEATTTGSYIGEFVQGTVPASVLNLGFPSGVQFPDGTAAKPGIQFNIEPGLGWHRGGTSVINIGAQGSIIHQVGANTATSSFLVLCPRAAGGSAYHYFQNQVSGAANYNNLAVGVGGDGNSTIQTGNVGTAGLASLNIVAGGSIAMATPNGNLQWTGQHAVMVGSVGFSVAPPAGSNATFYLTKPASGFSGAIYGRNGAGSGGGTRWGLLLGNGDPETGSNAGSNFVLDRYNDSGGWIGNIMTAYRADGRIYFSAGQVDIGNGTGGATINLNSNTASGHDIIAYDNNKRVWLTRFGAGTGGGGSDFNMYGYNDAGSNIAGYMVFGRLTGDMYLYGTTTVASKAAGSTSWVISSDERLKKNIAPYAAGLPEVLQIEPITFDWADDELKDAPSRIGTLAQHIRKFMPETVREVVNTNHKYSKMDLETVLTLDVAPITWALVNAIKTLDARLKSIGA